MSNLEILEHVEQELETLLAHLAHLRDTASAAREKVRVLAILVAEEKAAAK